METQIPLIRPAAAGLAYAAIVFAAGFALGAIRVFFVVPRIGATAAVLAETPIILALSWRVSRACIDRLQVRRAVAARLVMGLVAFLALVTAEATLSAALFGRSFAEYLASLTRMPDAIGFAAQVAFAAFPLVQRRGPRPSK